MERTLDTALPATPTPDPAWLLVEDGFEVAREHEIESLFTVSNGYVGTRGSLAEGSPLSAPASFVAGVYAQRPELDEAPVLAVAPDWTRLHAVVADEPLRIDAGGALEHRRTLDLRQGIVWRHWRQRDRQGRITHIAGFRLASLADRHLLLQSVALRPENFGGRVRLESRVSPAPPAGAHPGTIGTLEIVPAPEADTDPEALPVVVTLRVPGRDILMALAVRSILWEEPEWDGGGRTERPRERVHGPGPTVERWDVPIEIGRTYRLDRLVCVRTSRDADDPVDAAVRGLARAADRGVDRIVRRHAAAWAERWRGAGVVVDGDPDAQVALRFAGYHLIAAADPGAERVSIGARLLTGDAYQGHIFWDTEIYMLPFFIFTHPPSARALLMYRYHTLPAAREKARSLGFRGALFAWESADTGEDVTPTRALGPSGQVMIIRTGELEDHISADVAYGVWQYWKATGDDAFFLEAGAEIVFETARFWASRGGIEDDGRFHIRHVIGPDEYHEDVDDDVYTNAMAAWNLERGAETASLLRERWPERWAELARRLDLTEEEADGWRGLAERTYSGFDADRGLYEQFDGYFDLEDVDLEAYEPRAAPMDVILGWETIQRTKVIKQPDVVMMLYLLGDGVPADVVRDNVRYYEAHTSHGSSLSPSIHALMSARVGDLDRAAEYFVQARSIDIGDGYGNAAGGVHAASLGGLWQAVVFGFAGVRLREDGISLDPALPDGWGGIDVPLCWRGRRMRIRIGPDSAWIEASVEESAEGAPPPERVAITVEDGPATEAQPGRHCRIERGPDGWRTWRDVE